MEKPCVISSAYRTDRETFTQHRHAACELLFVQSGAAVFYVGQKACTVRAGDSILITALEAHRMEITERPYRRFRLILAIDALLPLLKSHRLAMPLKRHTRDSFYCFHAERYRETVESLYIAIHHECEEQNVMYQQSAGHALCQLFILLYRENQTIFDRYADPTIETMVRVQEYIEKHYSQPITVAQLAKTAYLSEGYLSSAFRAYAGYSPKQFLQKTRLRNAMDMLLCENVSVLEASRRCGYRDVNNFIRAFKQSTGVTPGAFRKQGAAYGSGGSL